MAPRDRHAVEVTLTPQIAIAVSDSSQAGDPRRAAARIADAIGFDEQSRGEVAIVATELATNLAVHARGGRLLIQGLDLAEGRTVEILSIDAGPGMADVGRCLQDGYSTGNSLGMGLPGARRLMDEFELVSTVGRGTTVTMRKWHR